MKIDLGREGGGLQHFSLLTCYWNELQAKIWGTSSFHLELFKFAKI